VAVDAQPSQRRIGFLAPMRSELKPLTRHLALRPHPDDSEFHHGEVGDVDAVASLANIGTAPSAAATARLLDTFDVHHVVVVGIAGSIDPALEIGELVVPEVVIDYDSGREFRPTHLTDAPPRGGLVTSDLFLHEPDVLEALIARDVVAVDMETAAVAAVCEERGVAWSVIRAISDRASDAQAEDQIMNLVQADGRANVMAVAKFLMTRPHRIPHLVRIGRGSQVAAETAARAAREACDHRTS
jgi:adenosylhomocysteine nucleosidase